MRNAGRRRAGLVMKFSLLMIVLVIIIVAGVAVPLMVRVIPRERRMLAEGLQRRAFILLESVALRAAEPIRTGVTGYPTVDTFPAEISAMPEEAIAMTISGPGDPERPGAPEVEDPADRDYLWATNDATLTGTAFVRAQVSVSDSRLDHVRAAELARSVNSAVAEKMRGTSVTTVSVETLLQEVAGDAQAGHTGTVPAFDPENLEGEYLFYRPLVTADANGEYFAGLVRLTVTTSVVSGKVTQAVNTMITITVVLALIAAALGVVGAVVLANIAVRPIGRLVRAVSAIPQTKDKSRLEEIPVGARDEIGTLSETVNEMIGGLKTDALAQEQMLLGRAIQKQFLPLEIAADGEKGSTGGVKVADIDLYAYYEGATKVSGDYFDWQKLDDRTYALMKCDVSGHGVEAAFIMVEVATLFLRWCREWKNRLASRPAAGDAKEQERVRKELQELDTLVYTINDMIEERGFKGRFAAFMLCLYDVRTGLVTACNAGDNKLYHFDATKRIMVTQEIDPRNPAVGQIASDLIASGKGYRSVQVKLGSGEVLVLITDGFEESKRHFRDASGAPIACSDPAHIVKKQDQKATHKMGDDYEEMSVPRILGILNAFFNRADYRLERHHIALTEDLVFDFSACTNSLEEAVLALVAVERVYRTYRDSLTGASDQIRLEKKVDLYLRKHFKQYEKYFENQDASDNSDNFVIISGIKEEVQEDDLTVVLLRRP